MQTRKVLFLLAVLLLAGTRVAQDAEACESCAIPRLGRQENIVQAHPDDKWFTHVLVERQDWNAYGAEEAHDLHHDGHHVHNKTGETFYHLGLGRAISEEVTLSIEIPWVVRESLGVEHANLGVEETSEGIGDLNLIGAVRIYQQEQTAVRAVGGVKFPTGETDEADSTGTRFEPELQPGSGSYDVFGGGVFEHQLGRLILKGNATYTLKNEGEQDDEFGDVFSSSFFADYVLNPDSEQFAAKAGLDLNYQYAGKDKRGGVKEHDSGGHTVLSGPSLTVEGANGMSVFANILFPVAQDLGGLHQELDYVWTAGGKVRF